MWFQEELISDDEICGADIPVVQQQNSMGLTVASPMRSASPNSPAAAPAESSEESSVDHKNRKRKRAVESSDEAELGQLVVKSISKVLAKGLDKL